MDAKMNMDAVEEPRTKEQELADAIQDVQRLKALVQQSGWKALVQIFSEKAIKMREELLNNATRIEVNGKRLDGMQGCLVEAMEKGQLKGIVAVLSWPEACIVKMEEQIDLLEKTIAMKEDANGSGTEN